MSNKSPISLRFFSFLASGLIALLCWPAAESNADDRRLLRKEPEDPYVFILLDTSGSMNWNVGELELPWQRADDPNSKMYQAKQAIYEVVEGLDGVNFGFGTFNQDQLRVRQKHYLYEAQENGVNLGGGRFYPENGELHVFGRTQGCVGAGCGAGPPFTSPADSPADLDDEWEARRMQMYSKGGFNGRQLRVFYLELDGARYEVYWDDVNVTLGANQIEVAIQLLGFNDGGYNGVVLSDNVTFELADGGENGFLSVDLGVRRSSPSNPNGRQQFFDFTDQFADETCAGWEPNTDFSEDNVVEFLGLNPVNLKTATDNTDPTLNALRRYGDVIPLNWQSNNRDAVLDRLAPNRLFEDPTVPSFLPDFGVARYLTNVPVESKLNRIPALRLAGGAPIIPRGLTPLGESIKDFRTWYVGSDGESGWRALASDGTTGDADFGCRNVYLLFITDGLETCGGDGEEQAGLLRNAGVRTYVVGYGVEASATEDDLDEIALAGGTGEPFRPQNVTELIDDLRNLFNEINAVSTSFSAAAVPAVQVDVADKVFFSNFTPLQTQPVWVGEIEAFLKPVPLRADGTIDSDRPCAAGEEFACLAWNAGEEVVAQSLLPAELDAATLPGGNVDPLGAAADQRRVFYSSGIPGAGIPANRSPFWADGDSTDDEWKELLFAFGIPFDPVPTAGQRADGSEVLKNTLAIRNVTENVTLPDGTIQSESFTYVLGDSFHSDPFIVNAPDDFFYFAVDYGSNGEQCDDPTDPNPGYRCFVEEQLYRRKMLIIGSNDGQLHGFDAGVLRERTGTNGATLRSFDNGTGREMFSYIPRSTMETVVDLSAGGNHKYGIDGTVVSADVFIDPMHNGVPEPTDREWRTVAVSGLREGGRGLFALDVTQPDKLGRGIDPTDEAGNLRFQNIPEPLGGATGYVPSCWDGDATGLCGPSSFPSMLWEFEDTDDLDGNGVADLGDSWSAPTIGLIRVQVGGVEEDRFVAVFGGGIDPDHRESDPISIDPNDPTQDLSVALGSAIGDPLRVAYQGVDVAGNWIYMVDMETGEILYKKRVSGAVASTISAVDANRDVYLDTLYFGTTAGLMYKVDIGDPAELSELANPTTADEVALWRPFVVFDTKTLADPIGKPIFYPPAVVYVAAKNLFALGFGTGYREDLWEDPNGTPGKYYLMLDEDIQPATAGGPFVPLGEVDLAEVDPNDTSPTSDNLLLQSNGWFMTLRGGERQISNTFAVAGVILFNTYRPDTPDPTTTSGGLAACGRTGQSRFYVVSATNANGFVQDPDRDPSDPSTARDRAKFIALQGFAAVPYVDTLGTKNQDGDPDDDPAQTDDQLSDAELALLAEIDGTRPDVCRFSNRKKLIKFRLEGRPQVALPFSVCTVQHNWREQ